MFLEFYSQKRSFYSLMLSLGIHSILILFLFIFIKKDLPLKPSEELIVLYNVIPQPQKTLPKIKAAVSTIMKQGDFIANQINKLSADFTKTQEGTGIDIPVALPDEFPKRDMAGILPETDFPVKDLILPAGSSLPQAPSSNKVAGIFSSGLKDQGPAGFLQNISSQIGIEWAGTSRRTLHQPPIPEYSSKIQGEVKLKFWVDPDGKVTNAVVMRKLDTDLERISLQYIKKWEFEALSPEAEQNVQWGTIIIKFKLRDFS